MVAGSAPHGGVAGLQGMCDRNTGVTLDSPEETSAYRDLMVMMVKDARRTVDYLVIRAEVDSARIAYGRSASEDASRRPFWRWSHASRRRC